MDSKQLPQPAELVPPAPWEDASTSKAVLAAFRSKDVDGVIRAFLGDGPITPQLRRLAQYLIAIRGMDISILGNQEVFVRRTRAGELRQVIQPVHLSLSDGTLYRISKRRKFVEGTDTFWNDKRHNSTGKRYEWRDHYEGEPGTALVSADGLNRINAVVGCSVKRPPEVVVNGERVANPYLERDDNGDIKRIVIGVNVAGPAETTGNVVVVQYQLDLEPQRDLVHMLANLANKQPEKNNTGRRPTGPEDAVDLRTRPVRMIPGLRFADFVASLDGADLWDWHWVPMHGGVGLAHRLTDPAVMDVYDKYLGLLQHVFRKAQTVAVRNAMFKHPSLARRRVRIDDNGNARIRAIGWAAAEQDVARYARALDSVAAGHVDPALEIIDVEDVYDPTRDRTGDPEMDTPDDASEEAPPLDPETVLRNDLLARLDELALEASPGDLARAGYPPATDASAQELQRLVDEIRAHNASPRI